MSTDPIAAGELGRRGAAATRLNYRKPCKVSARRNKGDHVAGMGAVSRQKTDMESRAGLRTQTAGRGRETCKPARAFSAEPDCVAPDLSRPTSRTGGISVCC